MKIISLNGKWKCKPDYHNLGIEYKWYLPKNCDINEIDLLDIDIPTSFNLLEKYESFEGIFWHFYKFDLKTAIVNLDLDYSLRFKGSNYNTKVWLNGTFIGEHNGGFTPFYFNINQTVKQKSNMIVVRTDNTRKSDQVPSISFDWFNWGGIYRDVDLLILNKNRIQEVSIITSLISRVRSKIEISFINVGNPSVRWEILDKDNKTILFQGNIPKSVNESSFKVIFNKPRLWSPEEPNLYFLKIYHSDLGSSNELLFETHFGIRQIEINDTFLYLNKKKILLKGVSLHEEYLPYGRTIPYEKRKEDIENIKSLGLNVIRTAHYSHDEDLLDIADKIGILILEEIPVYQHCNFKSIHTYITAENMLRELIKRDINHPLVIWWSVGNEVPLHKRSCSKFIKKLMDFAREQDNSRIVTCVSRKLIPDLTRNNVDIATINSYFGWYYGHEKMISFILDLIRTPAFNKPWIYTEFGAGAKYGFHADWKKRLKYSEEEQLQVLEHTIRTINSKDFYAGWIIWIYRDFKSPRRRNQFQQGFNRKGIVSGEGNEKKLIYYRLHEILDQKRSLVNTKLIGIILWIIFFPYSYFIFTRLIDYFQYYIEKKWSRIK